MGVYRGFWQEYCNDTYLKGIKWMSYDNGAYSTETSAEEILKWSVRHGSLLGTDLHTLVTRRRLAFTRTTFVINYDVEHQLL